MRRRAFIAALGGAAAWPYVARAQGRVWRVGVLLAAYTETDRAGQARIASFRNTLQGLGWDDDRNIRFDYRWSGGSTTNVKTLAADLVQSAPDAIVVAGDPALTELHKLPSTIPILFTQVSEPVDCGPSSTSGDLSVPIFCDRRWTHFVWPRSDRSMARSRALHRPHPPGRETGEPTGAGAD